MLISDDLEKKIEKHEFAFQELLIKVDALNQQVDDLFSELNVTPEQVTAFISNKENFTEENWQTIMEEKQKLESKLKMELSNIRNPRKNQETYSKRVVQHWLFVR